ncbi:Aldo-keto reductase [Psilocybe cubensis]|uniref:NADP-dependent oxidoreductase domain-containing protein n=2 Tax=Psilocybe cubensis TaxID=181762 RepID=A0A8H7Y466_PSICU|nr:Aldo-keto reductase [Psilocybe cubensis]KAH9483767.1 Aldo-keto reductase [Psilocybe cubensis]
MASNTQKTALNIVMGAMTFGAAGTHGARVHDIKDVQAILEAFRAHGHSEIDTARVYGNGTSEEYLGKLDLESKGFKIQTKLYPFKGFANHDEEDLRKFLAQSLKALNVKTLDIWYLHGPDRSVPYEKTLKVVNELYKDGYFKKFGISNYTAWEVAEIVGICKANGYVQPTVYQGLYNAIHRAAEPELFPCLRKFGIAFYEFNPCRYWKDPYFKGLASVKAVADKHGLTLTEIALRWVSHHSALKSEYGDSVLIGASSVKHIEQNLIDLEKGPLPDDVVKALDDVWLEVKAISSPYYH